VRRLICDFVTDDSLGTASGVTTRPINGELVKVVTIPGDAEPSDNWDLAITDEHGLNVLAGCQNVAALGTRDTANTEQTYLQLLNADETAVGIAAYPVCADRLTVAVANAGNSKSGRIVLYYRQ